MGSTYRGFGKFDWAAHALKFRACEPDERLSRRGVRRALPGSREPYITRRRRELMRSGLHSGAAERLPRERWGSRLHLRMAQHTANGNGSAEHLAQHRRWPGCVTPKLEGDTEFERAQSTCRRAARVRRGDELGMAGGRAAAGRSLKNLKLAESPRMWPMRTCVHRIRRTSSDERPCSEGRGHLWRI